MSLFRIPKRKVNPYSLIESEQKRENRRKCPYGKRNTLIQHYVIKFVSDLRQVPRFPSPIKLTD